MAVRTNTLPPCNRTNKCSPALNPAQAGAGGLCWAAELARQSGPHCCWEEDPPKPNLKAAASACCEIGPPGHQLSQRTNVASQPGRQPADPTNQDQASSETRILAPQVCKLLGQRFNQPANQPSQAIQPANTNLRMEPFFHVCGAPAPWPRQPTSQPAVSQAIKPNGHHPPIESSNSGKFNNSSVNR